MYVDTALKEESTAPTPKVGAAHSGFILRVQYARGGNPSFLHPGDQGQHQALSHADGVYP